MTARHVIEDAQRLMTSLPGSSLMIGQAIPSITDPEFTIRGSFNYIRSKIGEEDPRHDIALIQAMQNPFGTEQRPFIKAPAPDTDVYPLLGLATLSTFWKFEMANKDSGIRLPTCRTGFGDHFRRYRIGSWGQYSKSSSTRCSPWLHHTEYR